MQQTLANRRIIGRFSCGRRAPCRTILPTSKGGGVESDGPRLSGQFNNWEIFLMNKKLLAVAVAGALAAPVAAFAQSSVTIYGRANLGLDSWKATGSTPGAGGGHKPRPPPDDPGPRFGVSAPPGLG